MSSHFKIFLSPVLLMVISLFVDSSPVLAHVEYYDLNQGVQIADLTPEGKVISQIEHGSAVLQDLPLTDPNFWIINTKCLSGAGNLRGLNYPA